MLRVQSFLMLIGFFTIWNPLLLCHAQTDSWRESTRQFMHLWNQKDFASAAAFAETAVEQARAQADSNPKSIISALNNLAEVRRVQQRTGDSQQLLEQALSLARKNLDKDDPILTSLTLNLARAYEAQGLFEEASVLYNKLLRERGINPNQKAETLQEAARFALVKGLSHQAELLLKEAVELLNDAGQKNSDRYNSTLAALAEALRRLNKTDETEKILNQVMQNLPDSNDPAIEWELNKTRAKMLTDQGRPEQAFHLLQQVFEKQREVLGPDHPDTINTQADLAVTMDKGNIGNADEGYREVLEVLSKNQRPDHPQSLSVRLDYAEHLSRNGYYDAAEGEMRKILEDLSTSDQVPVDSSLPGRAFFLRSRNLSAQGRFEEAAEMAREAAKAFRPLGTNLPEALSLNLYQSKLLSTLRRGDEARLALQAAQNQWEELMAFQKEAYEAEWHEARGAEKESAGDLDTAAEEYRLAFEKTKLRTGDHTAEHAERAMAIARVLEQQGKPKLARDWRLRAAAYQLQDPKKHQSQSSPDDTGWSHLNPARKPKSKNDPRYQRYQQILDLAAKSLAIGGHLKNSARGEGGAIALFERALEIYEAIVGPNDPELTLLLDNYAAFLHDIGRKDAANEIENRSRNILQGDLR